MILDKDTHKDLKHKIWSPVPRKLRKIEDEQSIIRAASVVKDDPGSPFSYKATKTHSDKSFISSNSAFRSIFAESNKLNLLKLDSSAASLSEKSFNDTTSDKGFKNFSGFGNRTIKNVSLNVDENLFGKQARAIETPKFRININSLNELPAVQMSRNPSSDYIIKSQDPFTESFLANGYVNLLASLFSQNSNSVQNNGDSPQEEHTHSSKCSHGIEKDDNKMSKFLKPNLTKKKTRHCNCKNSKCLKLYCECLAHGEYCDDRCNCCDCHNNVQKEEVRAYALSLIMEKKPEILEGESLKKQNRSKIVRGKGCNCKKSACLKKYCECYNSGTGCGPHCKCEGCKNPHTGGHDSDSPVNEEADSPFARIAQDLGLGLRTEICSEKSINDLDLQFLKPQKTKSVTLFNRSFGANAENTLPIFGFGNNL